MLVVALCPILLHSQFDNWIGVAPPSVEIERLAISSTMTREAQQIFYRQTPTIEPKQTFFNICKTSKKTNDTLIMFGCYFNNGKSGKIAIQSVTDDRFQGVMEVTAAHEMLHVVYQRMTLLEQNQINKQLQAVLEKLENPRILKLVQTYREQDPRSVDNELHSILATEVRNLGSELEEHYRQYFTDRSAIVALSERYEGVFTALRDKAKNLNQQLATRKSSLEQLVSQVKQEAEGVDAERSSLQNSISSSPQSDYNFRVSNFNDRVNSYNRLVSRLKEETDTYNQKVTEHNSLALEEKSLVESLENKSK